MENLFKNLYLYELVLLFLGVFLFVLLCAGLVYYIIKKDDIKKLLYFFVIPIVMIGYPSIQEIQIEKDKLSLIKYTDEVLENPDDKEAQEELQRVTQKLEKRARTSEDLKAVSEANLVLGNPDRVIDLTNQAIQKEQAEAVDMPPTESPGSEDMPVAEETKPNIESLRGIQQLATYQKKLDENPAALEDTTQLQEQIQKVKWNNPKIKTHLNKRISSGALQRNNEP